MPGPRPQGEGDRIALHFEYFSDFIQELSASLSPEGMFIKTAHPREAGDQFEFEFRLGDDFSLLRGKAEVLWRRSRAEGSDEPAGMAVRFVRLDETSRRVVERIVEQRAEQGEPVFDLGLPPAEAGAPDPSLAEELARARGEADEAAAVRLRLEARLEKVDAARQASERALREARSQVAELENERRRHTDEIERLSAAGRKATEILALELQGVREELSAAHGRLAEVEGSRGEMEESHRLREDELETWRERAEAAEGELGEAHQRIGGLEQRLERSGSAEARLRSRLEKGEKVLAQQRARVGELEKEIRALSRAGAAADQELPAELEAERAARSAAAGPAPPPAVPAARGARRSALVAAVVAGLLLGAAAGWWLARGPSAGGRPAGHLAERSSAERTAAGTVPAVQPAAAEPASPGGAASVPDTAVRGGVEPAAGPYAPEADEIEAAVLAWASAWSAQDVEAYLAAYARGFEPPGGLGRREWEAQRRQRLRAPASIRVEVSDLELAATGDGRMAAVFTQLYASDSYGDTVRKRLELVAEDGGWKIASERAE